MHASLQIHKIRDIVYDDLYRNSFFIVTTSICSGCLGFVFWMLAAHLYSMEDVGIATALISSMTLILSLSKMGLDISIIRYFPESDKNNVLNTALLISTLFTIIFGTIFTTGINHWSPELGFLRSSIGILFISIVVVNSIISLSGVAFTAIRKSQYFFFQSILLGSRLIFLIPLIHFGTLGLFGAYGISSVLTLLFTLHWLNSVNIKPMLCIDKQFIRESFHFSVSNYASNIFNLIPNSLLPILVLSVLGAEMTAQFFIVFTMVSVLFTIPSALSTSLLVAGSNGEPLQKSIKKAMVATYVVLTPAAMLFFFFGGSLLSFMGKSYSGNGVFFGIMILSSFLMSALYIYISVLRIKKETKEIIYLTGMRFVIVISLSIYLMRIYGLNGVGYAWILSYGLIIIIIGINLLWKRMRGL